MKLVKRKQYQPTFNAFFDDFFTKDLFKHETGFNAFKSNPPVNIIEKDDAFTIELAAPGLKKEDFVIELDKDVLTVSLEKNETETKSETETKDKYTKREFDYSTFKRAFNIPENTVDTESIIAVYKTGILSLLLPKKEEAKVQPKRTIDIG